MRIAYQRGLHELGDGLYCYLQPDGTWGWSNAGLIAADGTSLLVDTLFDLELTRAMLDAMRPITDRSPIDTAMNTPQLVDALKHADALGPDFSAYITPIFGPFRFEGIELRPPSSTFEGRLELTIGNRAVHFLEVGPAHTDGDAIVHVPDAGVVFTGDILFVEGTPIVWAGPFSNWLGACDRILALDAPTLVPRRGPVSDASGVHDVRRYLTYVRDEAKARFDAGMDAEQAADDIDLSDFAGWGDPERIAVNVATAHPE